MAIELEPGPLDSYATLIVRTDDEHALINIKSQVARDDRLSPVQSLKLRKMVDAILPCPYCGNPDRDHSPSRDCTGRF